MRRPTEIESLYIDFDSYFANAEKQLRPELRGRPVGIIPMQSRHTSLIACCYEAKATGLKRGASVDEARALCPDIALVVARHDEYVKMHQRILAEVNQHVPVRKVWSVDEVECELIGSERRNCVDLAHRIRRGLSDAIGPWVTPSIGLASNQFLAKVAAEMDKPNGLVMLHPDDLPGRLFDLDITDLPGIARGMQPRLERAGVTTIQDLWHVSPKQARAIWRSVEGERMWAQLRGYAVTRPDTVRRMFGHGRVLSGAWRTPEKARDCLRLLTAKAARRLRREDYTARRLRVSLTAVNDLRWGGEVSFFPASDDHTFLREACTLFETGVSRLGKPRLKKVAIMLHGIAREGEISNDLFEHASDRSKRQRWENLTTAMDTLNAHYGERVISLGFHHEPPGGYAGAKIAFGRVPHLNDFI